MSYARTHRPTLPHTLTRPLFLCVKRHITRSLLSRHLNRCSVAGPICSMLRRTCTCSAPLRMGPDVRALIIIRLTLFACCSAVNFSHTNQVNGLTDLADDVGLAATATAATGGSTAAESELQGRDLEGMLHWAIGRYFYHQWQIRGPSHNQCPRSKL